MTKKSQANAYKEAGVNVNAGYESVEKIKPLVQSTFTPEVLSSIGGFGGLFMPELKGIKKPVLVSGTDGVGTKLKLAFDTGINDTVGIDCVAMCVNDIICSGARPMFFLDYIACGKNEPEKIKEIVSGIVEGCRQSECALIGGETAEMPGFYPEEEYDIAGFSVGIVDKDNIISPENVKPGDILIGLDSSGVHSNGFSLIRKLIRDNNLDINETYNGLEGKTLGEALLEPTNIYVKPVLTLIDNDLIPHGISHITGGGFYENIPRMLPENMTAVIKKEQLPKLPIFEFLRDQSGLDDKELYSTFNMGIGMVLAVDKEDSQKVLQILNKLETGARIIGEVQVSDKGVILE